MFVCGTCVYDIAFFFFFNNLLLLNKTNRDFASDHISEALIVWVTLKLNEVFIHVRVISKGIT